MEYIKLKDLCEKEERFVAPNDDAHIDYVDISSVDNKSKSLTKYDTYIFAEAPSRARKRVKHGDVIVSTVRPNLNAVARFNIQTPHTPIASTGFCVLRHKSDVDPIYIYFFCISPNFVRQMVAKATGASYPAVSDTIVREAKIPKHTAEKRVRIVSTLSKAKEIIEYRRAQLAKLDELVKCRFVEMFGDIEVNPRRLPILPWNQVFHTTTGKLDANAMEQDGIYPFFTCAKESYRINSYAFDCEALLLAGNNAAGVYDVKHYKGKFNAYQRTYVLKLRNENWSYLLFKLQLENKLTYMQSQSKGTNTRYLTMGILNEINFIIPSVEEQQIFADFVHHIDKLRIVIRQSLDEAQTLFDSLMQEYFD